MVKKRVSRADRYRTYITLECIFNIILRFLGYTNGNFQMSRAVRKPPFCICENKDADQLRGNREADQRLCFRYMDRTIPLVPKYEISSL